MAAMKALKGRAPRGNDTTPGRRLRVRPRPPQLFSASPASASASPRSLVQKTESGRERVSKGVYCRAGRQNRDGRERERDFSRGGSGDVSGSGSGSGSGNESQVAYEKDAFRNARVQDTFRDERGSQREREREYAYGGLGRGGGGSDATTSNSNSWWNEEMSGVTKALLAGSFVFGIAFGAYLNGEANFQPNNVASTEIIDRKTPSSAVCMANGYSSMVFDQRVFVSFNPFNVYVTSPEVKPGCVLRQANVQELEKRKLVSRSEADVCRKGMNTFAYVGSLDEKPEVSCVYHSEEAENQFMYDPKKSDFGDTSKSGQSFKDSVNSIN